MTPTAKTYTRCKQRFWRLLLAFFRRDRFRRSGVTSFGATFRCRFICLYRSWRRSSWRRAFNNVEQGFLHRRTLVRSNRWSLTFASASFASCVTVFRVYYLGTFFAWVSVAGRMVLSGFDIHCLSFDSIPFLSVIVRWWLVVSGLAFAWLDFVGTVSTRGTVIDRLVFIGFANSCRWLSTPSTFSSGNFCYRLFCGRFFMYWLDCNSAVSGFDLFFG